MHVAVNVTDLEKLPARAANELFRVVVETPRGSNLKLKYEPELGVFMISRPLALGLSYPFDWGFVPSTSAPDGDPLDAMVLMDGGSYPGVVIACRPIGVLSVTQKKSNGELGRERNDRLIVVAARSNHYDQIHDVRELPLGTRQELEAFFANVVAFEKKDLELEGWAGPDTAVALISECGEAFARKHARRPTK